MKTLSLIFLILIMASVGHALPGRNNSSDKILDAATTTGAQGKLTFNGPQGTIQCVGTTSAGSGASVILIEVSNVTAPASATSVDWQTAGTITLTLGTTQTGDGFTINAPWRWIRAKVSSISGTNATLNCYMGKPG